MVQRNWKFFAALALVIAGASTWGRIVGHLTPEHASAIVGAAAANMLAIDAVDVTVFSVEQETRDTANVAARLFGRPVQLKFVRAATGWEWTGARQEADSRTLTVEEYVSTIRNANERSAYDAVEVINTAEVAARIRSGRYLDLLALKANGLLVWNVTENPPRGYRVELQTTGDRYGIYAVPTRHPRSGVRSFYSDQALVVRAADRRGGKAGPDDPEFVP
jgi:hypothetical protein